MADLFLGLLASANEDGAIVEAVHLVESNTELCGYSRIVLGHGKEEVAGGQTHA